MEFTINTARLKHMLSKAIKGAKCDKLVPITNLVAIQLKKNKLSLITSSDTTYLYVTEENIDGDDFYVVVPVDKFNKLISKLTCENVTLKVVDDAYLEIHGNGTYSMELPMDLVSGKLIKYPDPVAKATVDVCPIELSTTIMRSIIRVCKSALATENMNMPSCCNYYVGDAVIASDACKIGCFNSQIFGPTEMLISAELFNLLEVITDEKFNGYLVGDNLMFVGSDCVIWGFKSEGIEEFPAEDILSYITQSFPYSCCVNKSTLLSAIDRVGLFVAKQDNKAIQLTFSDNSLRISTQAKGGIEDVPFTQPVSNDTYSVCVNIDVLTSQLKAYGSDTVEIHYGLYKCMKLVDGDFIQILALMKQPNQQ